MTKNETIVHVITVVDGKSEELVDILELKNFVASEFYHQFDVDPVADPEMLDRYSIGPDDLSFLEKHLGRSLPFDFQKYAYFIEAAKKQT